MLLRVGNCIRCYLSIAQSSTFQKGRLGAKPYKRVYYIDRWWYRTLSIKCTKEAFLKGSLWWFIECSSNVLCFEWWLVLLSGVSFWRVVLRISFVCIEGGVKTFPSYLTLQSLRITSVGKLLGKWAQFLIGNLKFIIFGVSLVHCNVLYSLMYFV